MSEETHPIDVLATPTVPALVGRTEIRAGTPASYICVAADGKAGWTRDPVDATVFASMREATRMALRLPASVKAYGLPRHLEVARIH